MDEYIPPIESSDYEEPKVTDYGDLTELTAGQANGGFTDKSFPVNTPTGDLTFSG